MKKKLNVYLFPHLPLITAFSIDFVWAHKLVYDGVMMRRVRVSTNFTLCYFFHLFINPYL